jgi:hypothetical protein
LIPVIELAELLPGADPICDEDKGVSETYHGFIATDEGHHKAYIKILDRIEMANELVATTIGCELGLRVPRAFLVRVHPEDLPQSARLQKHGRATTAFATADLEHPSLRRRVHGSAAVQGLVMLVRESILQAVIFDDWVANIDRNLGNLLISPEGGLHLIDHGQCFTGPCWEAQDLVPDIVCQNILGDLYKPDEGTSYYDIEVCKMSLGAFQTYAGEIDIGEALAVCYSDHYLSRVERNALIYFLSARIMHLHDLLFEKCSSRIQRANEQSS